MNEPGSYLGQNTATMKHFPDDDSICVNKDITENMQFGGLQVSHSVNSSMIYHQNMSETQDIPENTKQDTALSSYRKPSQQVMVKLVDEDAIIDIVHLVGYSGGISNSLCDLFLKPADDNSSPPKVYEYVSESTAAVDDNTILNTNNEMVDLSRKECSDHEIISLKSIPLPHESANTKLPTNVIEEKKINKLSFKKKEKGWLNRSWDCPVCSTELVSQSELRSHLSVHTHRQLVNVILKLIMPIYKKRKRQQNIYQENIVSSPPPIDNYPKQTENVVNSVNYELQNNETICKIDKENLQVRKLSDINENEDITPVATEQTMSENTTSGKVKAEGSKLTRSVASGPSSRDPHSCPICKKVLSSRGNLSKHLIQHKSVKPWVCKLCNIGFNSKRDHDQHHMQKHTNSRPNVCHLCGKGFICKGTLNEHMIFHSQERKFSCEICGKKFRTSKCVKRHLQRHNAGKNFACEICCKLFRVKSDLTLHTIKIHSKKSMSEENYTDQQIPDPPDEKQPLDKNDIDGHQNIPEDNRHKEESLISSNPIIIIKDLSDILLPNNATGLPDLNSEIESSNLTGTFDDRTFIADESVTQLIQNRVAYSDGADDNCAYLTTAEKESMVVHALDSAYVVVGVVNDGSKVAVSSTEELITHEVGSLYTADGAEKMAPVQGSISTSSKSVQDSCIESMDGYIPFKSDILCYNPNTTKQDGVLTRDESCIDYNPV